MKNLALIAVTTALLSFGASAAYADDCSGHDHDGATAAGAVGGGLIAGLATHNVAAGLGGAVVGGLIGNSIARNDDCEHHADADARANDRAYSEGYDDRAAEERQASAPPPDAYDPDR